MPKSSRELTKISRTVKRYATCVIRNYGIGYSEYECLHFIRHNPGASQESLREWMMVDKAAVSRMVNNLEKKGYIVRKVNEQDRRANALFVTEPDTEIHASAASAEVHFYDWLMADIDDSELEIFRQVLHTIYLKSKDAGKNGFRFVPPLEAANLSQSEIIVAKEDPE